MPEHRQEFQRELEAIEANIIEMFAVVAEDLSEATRALVSDDVQVAELLAERGQVIDALYPEIEQLASREIALQAPVASDLRFLLSVLQIVPELARSHHLVVHIAHRGEHILSEDLSPRCRGLFEREGNLASAMWREAADSWYQRRGGARQASRGRRRSRSLMIFRSAELRQRTYGSPARASRIASGRSCRSLTMIVTGTPEE